MQTDNVQQLKTDSWRMFDRIAPRYDFANSILSLGLDGYWRHQLSNQVAMVAHSRVLDVATGTGKVIRNLYRHLPDITEIIGIDLSEPMLQQGKKKVSRQPWANKIKWQVANAGRLPFKAVEFPVVTAAFGIRNMPDVAAALAEIHRVLAINGWVFILEFSRPGNRLLSALHTFFLRYLIPSLGFMLTRDRQAYQYLQKTIFAFPSGHDFLKVLTQAGFRDAALIPLSGGIVTIYKGRK